jgi:4-hydroxy-2-oxoheptanedioate aldolase
MRFPFTITVVGLAIVGAPVVAGAQVPARVNPMVALLEQGKPVFGLYAPSLRSGNGPAAVTRTPAEIAREIVAYAASDYVFDGSMEGGVERGLPAFENLMAALRTAGATTRKHPLVVKTAEIAPDPAAAAVNIARQLDAGASTVVFVSVESAEEVRHGLAAMRFRSKGGTRPDAVGSAPAYWGMSEQEYRQKADLWPLNPEGELVNWTIIESLAGLENVRAIAAVEGIGVLLPGAGTLRGVFSTTGSDGQRVLDVEAWEAAIQKVLAACKEFHVPCGYPANASDIEMRMKQGFSVFVVNWGEPGFETVELGRRLAGR